MASLVRYKPANSMASLSPEARADGHKSMAELLLSPQVLEPTMAVAKLIAEAAKADAPRESSKYADSIEVGQGDLVVVDGNPRISAFVSAHGGIYKNARSPESSIAAVVEFGNSRAPGRRVLGRAGDIFHTEKKPL